jgi:predicted small metal-binding protein
VKSISCNDVVAGCSIRITSTDVAGVLGQLVGHVSRDHGMSDIPVQLIHKARAILGC